MRDIGKPDADSILRRLEAAYETAFRSAYEWSESPDRDVATAIWGDCIKQANGWIWRRSDDIVFKLSESRRIAGVGNVDLSIYTASGLEIVLNGEAWEPLRKDRIVWTDSGRWRAGPWWNWLDEFASANAVAERLASERNLRLEAWKRRLEDERARENGLIDAWSKRHSTNL